jgi:hypothetical protein
MIEKIKRYWDNFDDELFNEYMRKKQIFKFKKQLIRRQVLYN